MGDILDFLRNFIKDEATPDIKHLVQMAIERIEQLQMRIEELEAEADLKLIANSQYKANAMKEINEEINLTISLMQTDIDAGAHGELQNHLYSLLEMKRNGLQKILTERFTHDQAPYKSEQVADEVKPLTVEELMAGGWWCVDVSEECANAFKSKGLRVFKSSDWGRGEALIGCWLPTYGGVTRWVFAFREGKQIHRVGNEFYWGAGGAVSEEESDRVYVPAYPAFAK